MKSKVKLTKSELNAKNLKHVRTFEKTRKSWGRSKVKYPVYVYKKKNK